MKQGYKYSITEMNTLKQNWKYFAEENEGEFIANNVKSFANFNDPILKEFELRIPYKDGLIIFFTNEFKPLKISYTFNDINIPEFLIYPEDLTDKIVKLFGLKEIEIGDDEFDRNFIIKGKNEELIKKVLFDDLKHYLLNNYISNFKLEKDNTVSKLELNLVINELDLSKIKEILNLFKECISLLK